MGFLDFLKRPDLRPDYCPLCGGRMVYDHQALLEALKSGRGVPSWVDRGERQHSNCSWRPPGKPAYVCELGEHSECQSTICGCECHRRSETDIREALNRGCPHQDLFEGGTARRCRQCGKSLS